MNRQTRVLGIGQCALDMLAVVDPYPAADEKIEVVTWHEQGGGPAATAMVTLARLGVSCSFAGVIGADAEGDKIRRIFAEAGVDASGLVARPHGRSQLAFIAVERSTGRRTIFWRRASAFELSPSELPAGFPGDFGFLHLDGMMEGISMCAARKARAAGIPVMLDAGRVRAGTLEIAGLCDYLVGSEVFARQTGAPRMRGPGAMPSGKKFIRFRDRILSLGVKAATFTLGAWGSFTFTRDDSFATPAFRVDVVDTTGAGDVFHGAYIYGLLNRWELRRVVEFASAVAAVKCTKIGGQAGIPTLRQVRKFLRSQSPDPNHS